MPVHGKQHPDCQRKPINDINVQQEREKKRQAVVFVSSSTLGAVYFAVHGGTGRVFFFFEAGRGVFFFFYEAGRGGCVFFTRRDGAFFFFSEAGQDGAVFCSFFEGRDGTVVFGGGNFFGGTGQNRYTVLPKAV